MGREGIEQTMQALEGIAVVAKAVREVTRDGKVNTADLPQLFTLLNNAGVIFEGIKGADKIDLVAFDNTDVGVPSKAWFAGDVTATAGANNLAGALALAVTDVNGSSQTGSVALGANEAVFFMYGGNTYALVNDGDAGYSATNDVLIKFTGSLDLTEGALSVPTFFA